MDQVAVTERALDGIKARLTDAAVSQFYLTLRIPLCLHAPLVELLHELNLHSRFRSYEIHISQYINRLSLQK
jgi:hypothetical protein